MERLYDITQVAAMLGTTSRTLRYYEEKGIIQSTAVPFRKRRQYSEKQIAHIKNILLLRALGLPISEIKVWCAKGSNLEQAMMRHKAALIALINKKCKELNQLEKALNALQSGEDIFTEKKKTIAPTYNRTQIASKWTECFLSGDYDRCFSYFTKMLQDYMPLPVFKRIVSDTCNPLGNFVAQDKIENDPEIQNVIYSYLKYQELDLCIKFVFHKDKIHGLWLSYRDPRCKGDSI
ncbi:MAG: MerR family transcriptional regulator [Ruminococcaceae bacterium]|nr:MerR family transcriptional regulator [Oscillospiraceae bacterium]